MAKRYLNCEEVECPGQILPVIPKGTRPEIVHATINSSKLWSNCEVLTLTKNMRLLSDASVLDIEAKRQFSEWALTILTTKNSIVEKINDYMLDMVPGEEKVYLSYDSPIHRNLNGDHIDDVHSPEFLNTITSFGLPNHKLRLEIHDMDYAMETDWLSLGWEDRSLRGGSFSEVMLVIRFLYPGYLYHLQMSGFPLSFNEDNSL
ncbi:PIF1-like helicase [Medicago truncatula]|uniref:ATP-dependent DNA helicase n=1 Tax=Medicago truncatula TaxID=3880 RepID=A0A072V8T3_MEDTR|nr:PIF1-like helicase [Medicago truncatula]